MRTPIWTVTGLLIGSLAMGLGCGDGNGGPMGPTAGTLLVDLTTPNADDGALLFTLSGATIDTVTVFNASRDDLFFRRQSSSSITGVVIGNLSGGALLRVEVPDIRAIDAYTVSLVEVADRANALRAALSGYDLRLEAEDTGP